MRFVGALRPYSLQGFGLRLASYGRFASICCSFHIELVLPGFLATYQSEFPQFSNSKKPGFWSCCLKTNCWPLFPKKSTKQLAQCRYGQCRLFGVIIEATNNFESEECYWSNVPYFFERTNWHTSSKYWFYVTGSACFLDLPRRRATPPIPTTTKPVMVAGSGTAS